MIINILLSIFGFIGTISAFGGKTWVEGDKPLLNRITIRGYISVVALFLTLCLALYKEINTNKIIIEKDTSIAKLQASVDSYKEILGTLKKQSDRQEQIVMDQFVSLDGTIWYAPNYIYPGSILGFFNAGHGGTLTLKYGNKSIGYREVELNLGKKEDGDEYQIPIIGNSGQKFEWMLKGKWEGKVFVKSTPRTRDIANSWDEEQRLKH